MLKRHNSQRKAQQRQVVVNEETERRICHDMTSVYYAKTGFTIITVQ